MIEFLKFAFGLLLVLGLSAGLAWFLCESLWGNADDFERERGSDDHLPAGGDHGRDGFELLRIGWIGDSSKRLD